MALSAATDALIDELVVKVAKAPRKVRINILQMLHMIVN